MANHLRQQIREAVGTTLTGLATTGANVFQSRLRPLQPAQLPALLIYTERERITADEVVGYPRRLARTLDLVVEAVVKESADFEDKLDTICKEVEIALGASLSSYTAGNLARGGIVLSDVEITHDIETDKPVGMARMTFATNYLTMSNAPDVAV